jgi:hypothetical protein
MVFGTSVRQVEIKGALGHDQPLPWEGAEKAYSLYLDSGL